jgi:hypothetical protein
MQTQKHARRGRGSGEFEGLVPGALVLDELSVLCVGKSADDLVFTVDGGYLPLFMQAPAPAPTFWRVLREEV